MKSSNYVSVSKGDSDSLCFEFESAVWPRFGLTDTTFHDPHIKGHADEFVEFMDKIGKISSLEDKIILRSDGFTIFPKEGTEFLQFIHLIYEFLRERIVRGELMIDGEIS